MKRDNYYSHAQSVLFDWGNWARRPQFWARLRLQGMWAALPIPKDQRAMPEIPLSPSSRDVHRAVMSMDDLRAGILYAFYVRQVSFDNKPHVFRSFGIGRTRFYELLKDATLAAFNASKRLDSEGPSWLNRGREGASEALED